MPDFQFTAEEIEIFRILPEDMLLELCRDLNMILPETVVNLDLAVRIVPEFLDHAKRYGLPFHKLNSDSLNDLTERELQILADICHVKPTVRAILKHGTKVFKTVHEKGRKYHAIRLNMITFLKPIIRYEMNHH